jgi:energy-converting hydrogenase Eha subunit C
MGMYVCTVAGIWSPTSKKSGIVLRSGYVCVHFSKMYVRLITVYIVPGVVCEPISASIFCLQLPWHAMYNITIGALCNCG